jgi:hypothetical protein
MEQVSACAFNLSSHRLYSSPTMHAIKFFLPNNTPPLLTFLYTYKCKSFFQTRNATKQSHPPQRDFSPYFFAANQVDFVSLFSLQKISQLTSNLWLLDCQLPTVSLISLPILPLLFSSQLY